MLLSHLRLSSSVIRKALATTSQPLLTRTFTNTTIKMSDPVTAYEWKIAAQSQTGGEGGSKGLEKNMEPAGNWTQLEYWGDDGKPYLKEYEGRGLLKDKAVLITGGDSGIGRSVAILMAREGADVSIVYLPAEEEDAQHTKKYIEKAGRKANLMALDITSEENCRKIIDTHMEKFGKLNCLVNNAAMQEFVDDQTKIDLDVVEKTFRTNVFSMFALTKFGLPHMKRGDSIISSTSIAGYAGNPKAVDYAATKGAIATMTRSLAAQLAPKGIRVNGVAPGIIWTPLQPATKGNAPEDMKNIGVGVAPLNRAGMPIEVATAYVFLASPQASYFTGEIIHGTGGLEMQG